MKIESGTGNGQWAGVDKNNRLIVSAETLSYQHTISKEKNQAYQVSGTATIANGEVVVLHLKNTSSVRDMVVTYIRHQVVDPAGGTAFPTAASYTSLQFDRTYTSGGSVVTPVNVAAGAANVAEVTAYSSAPTAAGTGTEIDRWYTKAEGDMMSYNKEGAVIILPGQTFAVCYTSDHTSGTVYSRVSFVMEDIESLKS